MKTALEWLEDTLYPYLNKEDKEYTDVLFNKAKEMEKEQLGNAFLAGGKSRDNLFKGLEFQTIEEYIEETFKSE